MRGNSGPVMMKEEAEKFFNKKASPESNLSSKEFMNKKITELAMSKPVGKILDSKISRKVAIPVGNAVIGGTRRLGRLVKKAFTFPNEFKMEAEKDQKYREEAPEGAIGGLNTKRRNTSNGSMR